MNIGSRKGAQNDGCFLFGEKNIFNRKGLINGIANGFPSGKKTQVNLHLGLFLFIYLFMGW